MPTLMTLIDAIIAGVREKRVQDRLLDKGEELTLAKAIEIPQQYEMSQKQLKIVRDDVTCSQVSTVAKSVQYKPSGQSRKSRYPDRKFTQSKPSAFCASCGKHPDHKWNEGKCPAKGSTCSYCHRPNHWMAVCRKRAVHTLNVEALEETDDEILNISLTDVVLPAATLTVDKWSVHLMILSQRVQFKIDTGAKCNTLTLDSYQQLVHTGELKRSNKLKPVAAVDLSVQYKQCATNAEFEIVDIAQESVLSSATAEATLSVYAREMSGRRHSLPPPDTSMVRKGVKRLTWSATTAFETLKKAFCSAPMLSHPDPDKPFIVEIDASTNGVGAVLSQWQGTPPQLRPCAFFSHKMSPAEQNYVVGNR